MSFPRYPKYKPSGVEWLGEVPEHWRVGAIKYFVLAKSGAIKTGPFGSHLTSSEMQFGTIKVYNQRTVIDCDFDSGDNFISEEKFAELASFETLPGDLLITTRGTIGRAAILPANAERGILHPCLLRLQPDNSQIDTEFLKSLIQDSDLMKTQLSYLSNATTIEVIYSNTIASVIIPVPPIREQRTIRRFLDRETSKIDGLVGEQRRLIELLKEKRQAVISHAVTKGLNPHAPLKPSGIEWLGDVPEHWEVRRLKHISPSMTVGIVVNPSTFVVEEGFPFIYGGDIREGVIDWKNARCIDAESSEANVKTRLRAGDLLTVRVGAPGVTAVVPVECEGGNCASVMLIRQGQFNSHWLCYAMNTRIVRFQVEVVQYGAAQEQFNISHAVNFWTPTPPRTEQDEIADYLDRETATLDALTAEAERAIELLQERRTALISAAVTGKIDVRGLAETEAA